MFKPLIKLAVTFNISDWVKIQIPLSFFFKFSCLNLDVKYMAIDQYVS